MDADDGEGGNGRGRWTMDNGGRPDSRWLTGDGGQETGEKLLSVHG
ncbi:MAG: hypothetical protein P8X95_25580 [Anaerolineales bacterium]